MSRVSNQCVHEYKLDVPHFFSKVDDSVEDYYNILMQTEDSQDLFVHLVCPKCYEEAHTYMNVEEIKEILKGAKIIQSKLKLI